MEIKSFGFKLNQIDEEGYFSGHSAIFDIVDLVGDVIEKGAFTKTIKENPTSPICWQHMYHEVLGVTTLEKEDNKGLYIEGKLNLDVQKAREAHSLLKQGAIKAMSFSYDAVKWKMDGAVRRLKELKRYEHSLVTFPAQPLALVAEVKKATPYYGLPLASLGVEWDANEAVGRLRTWAGGEEDMDWDKYRKGFFWYDEENPEIFGSYKLPYADIIEGTLTAIPRGIFAVAGVLQGARGGVDIPADDIESIKKNIEIYYEKMDRVVPWKSRDTALEIALYTINGFKEDINIDKLLSFTGFKEHKYGRTLSAINRGLIESAIETLRTLLALAEEEPRITQTDAYAGKPLDEKKVAEIIREMKDFLTRRVK